MTGKKVADATARLNAQARRDDEMQARMDKISPRAGLAYAEKREAKDAKNRGVFDNYKKGFLNFGRDIDGLDLSATTMDYSGIKKQDKIEVPDTSSYESDDRQGGEYVSKVPIEDASEGWKGDQVQTPGGDPALKEQEDAMGGDPALAHITDAQPTEIKSEGILTES